MLNNHPKSRSSDAGNSYAIVTKVLPLNEKICRKDIVYIEFSTICKFRDPLEVLEYIPLR